MVPGKLLLTSKKNWILLRIALPSALSRESSRCIFVINRWHIWFQEEFQIVPANLLVFSLFDHLIFADFVRFFEMCENANLCTVSIVLNTVMIVPVLNSKKLQHFLLDRVAKFTSLCLEQVRLSLSRPNLPTQIPVECPPLPLPSVLPKISSMKTSVSIHNEAMKTRHIWLA